jgi:nicotinamide-nucleotide amidase
MIHVPARLIRDYGAVSNQVARAMADGARNTARTDASPSRHRHCRARWRQRDKKPVGLVYVAVSSELATVVIEHQFRRPWAATRCARPA